mgnify:CR=1 FL=1
MIPEVCVRQRFPTRNRKAGLMRAVAAQQELLGIGKDGANGAMVERDGGLQVMGKGTVTIVDPGEMSHTNYADVGANDPISLHNLRVHILSYGDRYHLHKRSLISQDG